MWGWLNKPHLHSFWFTQALKNISQEKLGTSPRRHDVCWYDMNRLNRPHIWKHAFLRLLENSVGFFFNAFKNYSFESWASKQWNVSKFAESFLSRWIRAQLTLALGCELGQILTFSACQVFHLLNGHFNDSCFPNCISQLLLPWRCITSIPEISHLQVCRCLWFCWGWVGSAAHGSQLRLGFRPALHVFPFSLYQLLPGYVFWR